MLHKTTLCALSALLVLSMGAPAFAKGKSVSSGMGQSEWIHPGESNYVPSGSFAKFLQGNIQQNTSSDDVQASDGGNSGAAMSGMSMGGGTGDMSMNGMGMQGGMGNMPMNGTGMQGGDMSMNGMGMQGGMNNMPMNGMGMQGGMNNMPMNGMGMQGGGSSDSSEGISNALAAAAAVGLAGQTALNGIGDSLRGMGFGGGFRSHSWGGYELSPFGGTGLGHHGPGRLGESFGFSSSTGGDVYGGSGGGGGVVKEFGRNINRAINDNVPSAIDQVTNRAMCKLLWNY